MNVPLIEMPKKEARAAFEEYRLAVRTGAGTEDDEALMRGYRELAKGNQVLDLDAAMRQGGVDERGRPRLAICRACAENCWFRFEINIGWRGQFSIQQFYWSFRANRYNTVTLPAAAFGVTRPTLQNDLKAVVPTVPPRFRPKRGGLHLYHILWEAEWENVPRDPMLLRHLGGTLYAVLAHWDLTELEMAVLKRRLTPR